MWSRSLPLAAAAALCLLLHIARPITAAPIPFVPARFALGRCDPSSTRVDCGYYGINETQCEQRGCCWSPAGSSFADTPWCFTQSQPSPACATTPPCSGHGSCTNDACVCDSGYATCSAPSVNDCSIWTDGDVNNCGSCGNDCPTHQGVQSSTCQKGSCVLTCSPGYNLCAGDCIPEQCSDAAPFTSIEIARIQTYFLANINHNSNGAVVAANADQTSNPDYAYHWSRDAGISINQLIRTAGISAADTQLKAYVNWVHHVQQDSDPNGIDVRGEPKFFLDGRVFDGGWMRPQNDAGAFRSIALINYANLLIQAGQLSYVAQNLYNPDLSQPGIKRDLDYIVNHWSDDSGDPWEEIKAQVFFVKHTMRHACILGSQLALVFKDSDFAATLNATARSIESNINNVHWSDAKGYIMEIPNQRELDSAVHLAFLYGDSGDGFYTPGSPRAQSSVGKFMAAFSPSAYPTFSINAKDDAAKVPGLLVGRYLNDVYNGGNPQQPAQGNPWILCSAALAEFFYRAGMDHMSQGSIAFSGANAEFFTQAMQLAAFRSIHNGWDLSLLVQALQSNQTVTALSQPFATAVRVLLAAGDSILLRIKYHVAPQDVHMTEQINKDSGAPQGARDLTWSYGTVLGAIGSRKTLVSMMPAQLQPNLQSS